MQTTLQKIMTFTGLILMVVMANLDATIVNLALPKIALAFNLPLSNMQWIVNIYLLATTATFVLSGKIADIYGRWRVYQVGVILFILGSGLSGFAQYQWQMLAGRAIQGFGFALTFTSVVILITSMFHQSRQGSIIGLTLVFSGIAQALGPPIGGLILNYLDWRWIFYVNLPLGVLSFFLIAIFHPRTVIEHPDKKIDYLGALLLIAATTCVITALNEITAWGLDSINLYLVFFSGIGFFWWLIKHSLTTEKPLIDVHFFMSRQFLSIITLRIIFSYNYIFLLFILPIFIQNILNYDTLHTSYLLAVMTLIMALSSPIVGKMADKIDPWKLIALSMVCMFISLGCFALTPYFITPTFLMIGLALCGLACGLNLTSSMQVVMTSIPEKSKGVGMGLFYTSMFLGGSLGVAIIGSLINAISHHFLFQQMQTFALPSGVMNELDLFASGARNINELVTVVGSSLFANIQPIIYSSFSIAFTVVMIINCLVCAAGLVVAVRRV